MNRELLRPALVALLAVVAIAVAGATIDSAVAPGGDDRDVGPDGEDRGNAEWWDFSLNLSDSEETNGGGGGDAHSMLGLCIQFLRRPSVILAALALVGVASLPVYRRIGFVGVAAVYMAVLPVGVLLYTFVTRCRRPEPQPLDLKFLRGERNATRAAENVTTPGGGGAAGFDPPAILVVLAGLVVLALVFAVVRSTGDDDLPEEAEPEPETDEAALAAIGEAAGDAADRIEDEPDLDNEVYRAWKEMTDHLDVPNPEASTPGEFARVATEAGMDREHVEALTDVFREVRYGGAEATAEHERAAVDALRRIEDAYAEEGEP